MMLLLRFRQLVLLRRCGNRNKNTAVLRSSVVSPRGNDLFECRRSLVTTTTTTAANALMNDSNSGSGGSSGGGGAGPTVSRQRQELRSALSALQTQYKVAVHRSKYDQFKARAVSLEQQLSQDNVWVDEPRKAREMMQALAPLTTRISKLDELTQRCDDAIEYAELVLDGGGEEGDSSSPPPSIDGGEAHEEELQACVVEVDSLAAEVTSFVDDSLVDPTTVDAKDCLMIIEAGNGGLDAKDWVAMLRSMYLAWGARRGFAVEVVSEVPDKVAGLRSCMLEFRANLDGGGSSSGSAGESTAVGGAAADCAFGWARTETGVHKLVRFSPFDKARRRQTSHAKVAVLPAPEQQTTTAGGRRSGSVDGEGDLMRKEDLKIDRFRSSGPGGQHANTTDRYAFLRLRAPLCPRHAWQVCLGAGDHLSVASFLFVWIAVGTHTHSRTHAPHTH